MKCPYCGAINDEKNRFCISCGKRLVKDDADSAPEKTESNASANDTVANKKEPDTSASNNNNGSRSIRNDPRIDQSEKVVCYVDTSYHPDIYRYGMASFSSLVTDKRVYMSGNCILGEDLHNAQKRHTEIAVNLEDISSSGFVSFSYIKLLISGIIVFFIGLLLTIFGAQDGGWDRDYQSPGAMAIGIILIIAAIILVIVFFCNMDTVYFIEYPGGGVAFDVGNSREAVNDYHKKLRAAADKRRREIYSD